MATTITEMAGGLLSLAIQLLILTAILEAGCRIFFWIREKESKGE
jgi:hypothetical protein